MQLEAYEPADDYQEFGVRTIHSGDYIFGAGNPRLAQYYGYI